MSSRTGHSKDFSAQDLKDIRHGVDVIASHRTTDNSSHTDNASGSLLNQMAATFSDMRTQSGQYSDTQTRSHEYAQMASYAENHSDAIRSNYTQEFVEYAKQNHPDAQRILTDVSSPEVREEREQLAAQFVQDRMLPQLETEFRANRSSTADGMGGVSPSGMQGVSQGEFEGRQQQMEQAAAAHGVRSEGSVAGEVSGAREDAQKSVDSAQETVSKQKADVDGQYNNMAQEHQVQGRRFDEANKAEHLRQDTVFNLPKKGQAKKALDDAMNEFKGK
ncbi:MULTISPECIES: hypothetical protein [unclassified Pantoea]|nr:MULTISPECIES: hypothetical protein [unclassified Pantoea]